MNGSAGFLKRLLKKLCIILALNKKNRGKKGLLDHVYRLFLLILTVPFFLLFVDTFILSRSGTRIHDVSGNAVQLWPSPWTWLKLRCHFSSTQIYEHS